LQQRHPLRVLTWLLVPLLASTVCHAHHRASNPGQPDIRSSSVLVLDEGSSTVLMPRKVDQWTHVA
jgi:hypothetical protein